MVQPQPQSSGCPKKVSTPWETLPEHMVTNILQLAAKEGWSPQQIADHSQLNVWTVRGCLRAHRLLRARGARPLDQEKLRPLLAALRLGQDSYKDLSRAYGVSRWAVKKYARLINAPTTWEVRARKKKLKDPKPKKPRKLQAISPRYDHWRDLWAAGRTMPEMAVELGISYQSVRMGVQWARKRHGWFPVRVLRSDRSLPTISPPAE